MMLPPETVVESYRLSVDYSFWGIPRRSPGVQPHLVKPKYENPFLRDHLRIQEEVYQFIDDVADVFQKWGLPPCPLVLLVIVLPMVFVFIIGFAISLLCLAATGPIIMIAVGGLLGLNFYCYHRRFGDIDKLMADWNQEKGQEMGLYFEWNADFLTYRETSKYLSSHTYCFWLKCNIYYTHNKF